tara:strand:+ start:610 stop:1203 length:594 start_codon:yes stop_codon:yes gene_type:complete
MLQKKFIIFLIRSNTLMPNLLTTIRILSPIFFIVVLFFFKDSKIESLLIFTIFILLSLTDFLDGYFARKLNQLSNYGKIFDPISDKILVSVALLYLTSKYSELLYPSILIIFREFLITGVREFSIYSKKKGVAVTNLSKIKTTIQFVSISGLLLESYSKEIFDIIIFDFFYGLLWIATLLTLFTGYEYCYKTYRKFN